jgi:hypothetical protein
LLKNDYQKFKINNLLSHQIIEYMKQFSTKLAIAILAINLNYSHASAQDLDNLLAEDAKNGKTKEFVTATFKGTRLINMHTIETQGKRVLEYRISHRFGDLKSGKYNAFGLDGGASIRMGLEYCVDGRFNFGIGRTNIEKTWDGYLKYRVLRQTTNNSNPISITALAAMYRAGIKDPNAQTNGYDRYSPATNRLSYCFQIMFARKFGERVSLQLSPTLVHFNLVEKQVNKNDMLALAAVGRFKVTKRMAITAEYAYRVTKTYADQNDAGGNKRYFDPLAIGIDIETGGHVFQIHVANSQGMIESQFLPYTTTTWKDWGVRIGFNISRVFSL